MIRGSARPDTRAASTYSSSRTEITEARISRKTPGDISTPKTAMAMYVFCPSEDITTSSTMIAGTAISRLDSQLLTASNHLR